MTGKPNTKCILMPFYRALGAISKRLSFVNFWDLKTTCISLIYWRNGFLKALYSLLCPRHMPTLWGLDLYACGCVKKNSAIEHKLPNSFSACRGDNVCTFDIYNLLYRTVDFIF